MSISPTSLNAAFPIVVRPVGNTSSFRSDQLLKALSSITVTLSGKVIFISLLQPENIPCLTVFVSFGRVALRRFEQPLRIYVPMLVTPDGISILLKLSQSENASFPMLVTVDGIVILSRLLQASNVLSSILVIPDGMVISVNFSQL